MPRSKIDQYLMQQAGKTDPDNLPAAVANGASAPYIHVSATDGSTMVAFTSMAAAIREIELGRTDYESMKLDRRPLNRDPRNTPAGYDDVQQHDIMFANGVHTHVIYTWIRAADEPRLFTVEEIQ